MILVPLYVFSAHYISLKHLKAVVIVFQGPSWHYSVGSISVLFPTSLLSRFLLLMIGSYLTYHAFIQKSAYVISV